MGRREYTITMLKQAMFKISEYIESPSYNPIISISSIGLSSTYFKMHHIQQSIQAEDINASFSANR
jgi:hypothetical protein